MKFNNLSKEEKRIIEDKGTEAPFSGEYEKFYKPGGFVCRRCEAPLYDSKNKFDSGCGWPSFDREISGAVKRNLDADGIRTEITCERCGAHLGHVFTGEKITPLDTRHCVNSLALKFVPEKEIMDKKQTIYLGGGCFWCLEAFFQKIKGIKEVVSGYSGGETDRPSYEEVCSGETGHAEVVKIVFDPFKISLEKILEVFFFVHDPTTLNRQGADQGTQYRSIILFENENQKEIVKNYIKKIEKEKAFADSVVTEVKQIDKFWSAEEYHQKYFQENPQAPYCQAVISPKMKKFRDEFADILMD